MKKTIILSLAFLALVSCGKKEEIKEKEVVLYSPFLSPKLDSAKVGALAKEIAANIKANPNDWTEIMEENGIRIDVSLENKKCNIKLSMYLGLGIGYSSVDVLSPGQATLDANDSQAIQEAYDKYISEPRTKLKKRKENIEKRKKEILRKKNEAEILTKICPK